MICYKSEGLILWRVEESENALLEMLSSCPQDILNDKNIQHKKQSMAVAMMTSELFGETVSHFENGKPYLKSGQANISISNTKDFVAIQYRKDQGVGVDIELVTRDASRVISRVATDDERELSKQLYPENGDILLWCLKEAAYKMVKNQPDGISLHLQKLLSIDIDSKTAIMRTSEGDYLFKFMIFENLLIVYNIR